MHTGKQHGHIGILPFLVTLVIVLLVSYAAYGKNKYMQYLPRDESVHTVTKTYTNLVVGELSCGDSEIGHISRELANCTSCVKDWRDMCPDCCLVIEPGKRATACSAGDNATLYDCRAFAFSVAHCSQLNDCSGNSNYTCDAPLQHCQNKGCAVAEPNPDESHGEWCVQSAGQWICSEDNLFPKSTGCVPSEAAYNEGVRKCQGTPHQPHTYYEITPLAPCPVGGGNSTPGSVCYEYAAKSDFEDCINTCINYTDESETCLQRVDCCKKQEVCPSSDGNTTVTRAARCDYTLAGACDMLINHPECDTYTMDDCTRLNNQFQDCINEPESGACYVCFEPFPDVAYTFVAKSKEKMMVIWQIATSNSHADAGFDPSSTYFYTRVKVTDNTAGRFVHESVVNQKSFTGAFNIFAATAVDKVKTISGERYLLEPGRSYTVRPYYYIAEMQKHLTIRITRIQLTILRIRD